MMKPLEKVRYLRDQYDCLSKYGVRSQLYFPPSKWQPGEVEALKKNFSWLSSFYFDFIEEFDSVGLGWFTFYGSKNSEIIAILDEVYYWKDNSKGDYFPFGKDPAGSVYTFNKQQQIICFDIEDYEWESPKLVSNSLEEFIDECLLGARYAEVENIENNLFYNFLKSQRWT